jgi:arylsulfatase A-like enzyme
MLANRSAAIYPERARIKFLARFFVWGMRGMKRPWLLLGLMMAWMMLVAVASGAERPPNFVLVYCDDMGYGDLSCYGQKNYQTPHLDRLASEGIRFTDFHTAAAVCSASRSALLTGCYPQRIGILGALNHRANHGINANEILLPELLKEQGYATAIYGKWHLGHHEQFLPTNNGFDDYFGLPYSNDMWPFNPRAKNFPPLPLIEGTKTIGLNPDQTKLTEWYTDRAVRFIEANKDKPFFLYVPHSMPHVPLFVGYDHYGKTGAGIYGDVIAQIDDSVGRIVETLKRLGLEENTLIVFSSDNGPWLTYGNHAGSRGHFREGKATTFEGGMRVPMIARWPGKIPAGKTCDELCSTMDILPTFAHLAGTKPTQDRIIDGHDIRPLLFADQNATSPYEAFRYYWDYRLDAIRSGPWKLHFPHSFPSLTGTPGRDGDQAGITQGRIELSLFNLTDDPGESKNVADQHPDVVERLKKLAAVAREDLGDGLQGMTGKNRRPAGQLAGKRD